MEKSYKEKQKIFREKIKRYKVIKGSHEDMHISDMGKYLIPERFINKYNKEVITLEEAVALKLVLCLRGEEVVTIEALCELIYEWSRDYHECLEKHGIKHNISICRVNELAKEFFMLEYLK